MKIFSNNGEYHNGRLGRFIFIGDGLSSILLIALSIYLLNTLIGFGAATTPDSVHYLDVAQNISDGLGLVESTYVLGPEEFKPLTTWPPLYPFVLSMFASPQLSGPIEAARLSFVSLSVSVLLMYVILRQFAAVIPALAGSLIFLFSHPVLTVFSFAWSEVLFIPLLLISILLGNLCIRHSDNDNAFQGKIFILLSAISLAALVYCRYIGVAFATLLPVTWILSQNRKKLLYKCYSPAFLLYTGFVGALLARNYFLTGILSGTGRQISTRTLSENFVDLWNALKIQFLYSEELFWSIFIVVVSAAGIKYYRNIKSKSGDARLSRQARNILFLSLTGLLSYLAALLILRTSSSFDLIDTRFISLIWSFIIILLVLGLTTGLGKGYRALLQLPLFVGSVILLVFILDRGLIVYNQVLFIQKVYNRTMGFYSFPKRKYMNVTLEIVENSRHQIARLIYDLKKYEEFDYLITDNDPRLIQLLSGIRSREFPTGTVTDDTVKLLNNSDRSGAVLLTGQPSKKALYEYYDNNLEIMSINSYFMEKYNVLLIPLPLPRK